MKKRLLTGLLAALLLLTTSCGGAASSPAPEDDTLHVLATTYPVYLFASAVAEGVEGVEVTRLITEEVSCLHDYTLTVNDMKAIEKADVLILNGAGLEDFMDDALATSSAATIDCSTAIDLLPAAGHHDHDRKEEENAGDHFDPHFWLDPDRAEQMLAAIAEGLSAADAAHKDAYTANAQSARTELSYWKGEAQELLAPYAGADLITFHDGFQYFAETFGLDLLKAIEEEEGAEASAAEIKEIVSLVETYDIPVIFTEKNGSDATARAIARETGATVGELSMLMSGEGSELSCYYDALLKNAAAIVNGFAGEEVITFER